MKIRFDYNHELHLMSHSFKIFSKYLMTISMNARKLSSFQKSLVHISPLCITIFIYFCSIRDVLFSCLYKIHQKINNTYIQRVLYKLQQGFYSSVSTNENPIGNQSTFFTLKRFTVIQVIKINFAIEYIRFLRSWSHS